MALFVSLTLLISTVDAGRPGDSESLDYARHIRPILVERCFGCHSDIEQRGDLRVDSVAALLDGGKRGAAVVPGDSENSWFIQAVVGTGELMMPPEGAPLDEDQIALLRRWVDQGAEAGTFDPAAEHWAFQPPQRPEIPRTGDGWARNAIDRLIAAEHQQHGLQPAGEAPPEMLLRRVYLDLTGLPPTVEEQADFLNNDRLDAYEQVVERLLASPRYGQRWGRHWMDVWRYSDWSGYRQEVRNSQPHVWHWRDWIVESLNHDKPYDQMIREMLAADELDPGNRESLRATGFLVRNWYKFNRNLWLEQTVEHTAKGFLGLTMNCAQCHDHMYDPITHEDYYAFRAFFETHDVRTDRLPNEPDVSVAGLPRVFDGRLEDPTYVFFRGDERNPVKDRVIEPALPEFFEADINLDAVDLPPAAYYPGLQPFIQQETKRQVEAAVAEAAEQLQAAKQQLAEAKREQGKDSANGGEAPALEADVGQPAVNGESRMHAAQAAVRLAKKQLAAQRAQRDALQARIAADMLRYQPAPTDSNGLPVADDAGSECDDQTGDRHAGDRHAAASDPGNVRDADGEAEQEDDRVADAIRKAVEAENYAAVQRARAELLAAEQAVASAQRSADAQPDNEELATTLNEARQQQDQAQQRLDETRQAQASPADDYSPLSEIYPPISSGRRLALARWIASRDNPLTARVAANQIWMRHFGEPLVENVFDFGLTSQPPRMAPLLDWLAVELMDNDWQMKHLHRAIVTSTAYRMQSWASEETRASQAADPDNRLLWRMNPRRMEAELVRDSVLYLADQLDQQVSGPELPHETGLTTHRRSLYYQHAYEKQMTFLMLFDVAGVDECYRRTESVVPQQALALANSSLAIGQARRLARQLSETAGAAGESSADDQFVEQAFQRILARPPSQQERQACLDFLEQQSRRLADPQQLTPFSSGEPSPVAPSPDPAQRARENLVHTLMNHNDFVTIR